jgi:hypothetical protein
MRRFRVRTQQELPSWATPGSALRLPPASQAARERHALLPAPLPARRSGGQQAAALPLYPDFDRTPAQPIDWGPSSPGGLAPASQPAPSAPPFPQQQQQPASLLDAEQPLRAQQQGASQEALLAQLQQPAPQLELQLGPQEVQVGRAGPTAPFQQDISAP